MSSVQKNNHNSDDSLTMASWCYREAPSCAFTKDTLEDILNRLGLVESGMTYRQLAAILNKLMKVCLNFNCVATDTDVFGYVTWADDDVLAESNCSGETYVLKFDKFDLDVRNEILTHINWHIGAKTLEEGFSLYQKKLKEICDGPLWHLDFVLDPIDYWEGKLPTRKQVLDLYHELYVLPAEKSE